MGVAGGLGVSGNVTYHHEPRLMLLCSKEGGVKGLLGHPQIGKKLILHEEIYHTCGEVNVGGG